MWRQVTILRAWLTTFLHPVSRHGHQAGFSRDQHDGYRLIVYSRATSGDVLLVTRLDPLARSTRDLLNVLDAVSKAGAGFRSLADAWADTTTAHGRLMLTILGGLAEFERELIKMRTHEGRVRAKARGVHMGRHSALNQDQQREALARIKDGDALTDIARTFGVSHTTIARLKARASLRT
jgi:DNA invertase Pin-like site-specific DNA recombinase